MPFRIGLAYLVSTIFLFLVGPFDWPLTTYVPVCAYLATLLIMLAIGHSMGIGRPAIHKPMMLTSTVFLIGAVSAIVLLIPSARIYTGLWPWQVLEALADQRDAYARLREQLVETGGSRDLIIVARTLSYPFVFAVLPLGVLYWRTLTLVQRTLLVLTVLSTLIFSTLRGTTRELADVVIIGGAAFLVSIYRDPTSAKEQFARNAKFLFRIGLLGAGVIVALVTRTAARMAGTVSQTSDCIGEGTVCTNYAYFPYDVFPDWLNAILGTVTGYFAQGYYGLALALQHDFRWTWGVGHSPALQTLYQLFFPTSALTQDTYVYRLNGDGWTSDYQWSTLPTWLASDLSFWLVPGAILLLGYFWARSWVDATLGKDDRAAIFFCALMMIIFYFPANNQMMNTLDNYAALVGWGVAWGVTRYTGRRVIG